MTTGTTATGTAWTGVQFTCADGSVARRIVPTALLTTVDIPCMIYFHGAGSAGNFFETATVFRPLRDLLLDAGWCIVESFGGPSGDTSSDGGRQNWGNAASRISYEQAFDWADSIHEFRAVTVLGRSMGGMNSLYFGTRHPTISSRVVGIVVNSGVQNLIAANNVPSGGNPDWQTGSPSGSGKFWPTMWTAHGVATKEEFAAAVSPEFDPHQFNPSVFAGKHIMQLAGTADNTVPPGDHAYAMRTLYAGQPAVDTLIVGEGKDHSSGNGMYDYAPEMWDFLRTAVGDPPDPPEPTVREVYSIEQLYLFSGGELYPVDLLA